MKSRVIHTYVSLNFFNTLAASFIWGVNTLFLLDAGLSNFEAFLANGFFTAGMVLFEVPTGVIADTLGRRISYLLGCATLFVTTLLYLYLWQMKAEVFLWCIVSLLLGLGFTFFSGAVEAWLVDALQSQNFSGSLEDVFSKGQIANGFAMLLGSVSGGYIAQATNLGVPYLLRILMLLVSFVLAFVYMKDLGFQSRPLQNVSAEMKRIFNASIEHGIKKPTVRWMMFTSPFVMGVSIYGFYAIQPYLLELYGDKEAYGIAGLAAALMAISQILGGVLVPRIRKLFSKRSSMLIAAIVCGSLAMFGLGITDSFWVAMVLFFIWVFLFAAMGPVKQAYLNNCISSENRATILSFDGLVGSSGGVVFQPSLGRIADVYSYGMSYSVSALIQIGALPFVYLAGKSNPDADEI